MTRRSLALLVGSAVALLALGPLPIRQAPTVGATARLHAAVAAADIGSAAVVADDDDSRQPLGTAVAVLPALGKAPSLEAASPNRILAQHRVALDPIPVGIRKLPASSDDPSASH